jgi:scyllo-inositol 2-dehydrogenase (NADP+)
LKIVQVAIIGQGRSGRDIHGAHLARDTNRYHIAAVVEPLADRRERAAREYGCDTYEHVDELNGRADIQLVVNSSPSRYHVPITIELLNHGFSVLCEKPAAPRAADFDSMCDAAAISGNLLAIFQQSRYAPYFRRVREVIDSGVLGQIVQVSIAFNGFSRRYDWQTLTSEIGGNLLNTGPHPLDQALQLFGGTEMPGVHCVMRRAVSYGNADDHTLLSLTGPGRPIVQLEISSCCTFPVPTYRVYGTRGGLYGDTRHLEWQYYDPAAAPPLELIKTPISKADGTPSYCSDKLEWIKQEWTAPHDVGLFEGMAGQYYAMLHRSLTESAPLEITLSEVRRQVAVIEECCRQNPQIWGENA